MQIEDIVEELRSYDDIRFKHMSTLVAKAIERYKAGEVSEEYVKDQLITVGKMLEIYTIYEDIKHKAMVQKVEDLIELIVTKGLAPFIKNIN